MRLRQERNGRHLLTPENDRRPLYQTGGGLHWLKSGNDGGDYMGVTTTVSSPNAEVHLGVRSEKAASSYDKILAMSGTGVAFSGGTDLSFNTQGISGGESIALSLSKNTDYVVGGAWESPDVLSGNRAWRTGTLVGSFNVPWWAGEVNSSNIYVFGHPAQDWLNSDARLYGAVFFTRVLDAGERAALTGWLAGKSGVVL